MRRRTWAAILASAGIGLLADALARRRFVRTTDQPGLLIVQVDGLGLPALHAAIRAGTAPFLASLLEGGYAVTPWHAMIPPTTPASQAGMLHGRNEGVPGFRWYEKAEDRLFVANHPGDATEILARLSDGGGLLAGGGVSIGNLLTGDARRSYLTMATVAEEPRAPGTLIRLRTFFVNPLNAVRIAIGMARQFGRELVEANRQARRHVEPRMDRGLDSALERAFLNSMVRNLSTELVIAEMRHGTPVIYVDYTGYDAIAHHAGPERPEALHAVLGIDRAIERVMRASARAARPYRLVVVSDHGQSLGEPFERRYGQRLDEYVAAAMGEGAESLYSVDEEHAHALPMIVREVVATVGLGSLAKRAESATRTRTRTRDGGDAPGPGPALVVCASGNLAHLYFTAKAGRLDSGEIEDLYPGMLRHLTAHPSVGLVLVRDPRGTPLVRSRDGCRDLRSGSVEGRDPLAEYGPGAAASLVRLDAFHNTGDVVVISTVEPDTGLVTSYEPLVGCHGGLGGAQEHPFLLYPEGWALPPEGLDGAPAVYRALSAWRDDLGLDR